MKTKVKFLYERDTKDVYAYFPEDGMCYAHIGQHSACSKEYVKECRTANKKDFTPLETELVSLGYKLSIIK